MDRDRAHTLADCVLDKTGSLPRGAASVAAPAGAESRGLGTASAAAPGWPPPGRAEWGETLAALDLGTNNCRLLVARATRQGFRVIDAFSRIVRLGEGLATSGVLSEAAMARTVEALKVCAGKIASRGVARGRYVATEACRRASNCAEFLDRVRHGTGLEVEIIATEEEARLAVEGCASLLDRRIPFALVFDIGGGSTEIVWLKGADRATRQLLGFVSVPHGVVSLTERYGSDTVSREAYRAMLAEVAEAIRPFEARHRIADRVARDEVQMLGSSGTVTTLAGIHLGLPRYNRAVVDGTFLSFAAVAEVSGRLAGLGLADRAAHPCVGVDRADLVVAGCAILEAICLAWPVGKLRVADRGVREGILIGLSGAR
jgi:exopolyphosphatase/guanosine-5'-triphosphate,3'-diphosphate pyrophosphatase